MNMQQFNDDGTIDLSKYTVQDSCFWLLHRLNVVQFTDKPYMLPFCSYVITWPKAVPITAIVMAQSPYPNDIFSPIAAAMSYDKDLCISKMKREIPPTVEILANDLHINAGMEKKSCIELIKNGWMLVEGGILLVNESVFYNYSSPQGYRESADQCNVIIRLLRETEKHGNRTVDIYAFGESGQRMASNLCSWYKSNVIKLSKHAVTHPAALSRRFTDFSDSNCHMNVPSFSKSLAKCLSNHVALLYTMAKQSEQDIKIRRQLDVLRALGENLPLLKKSTEEHTNSLKELLNIDTGQAMSILGDNEVKKVLNNIVEKGEACAIRIGIAASLMANLQTVTQTMSSNVSKSAPSLGTVNPNSGAISASSRQNTTGTFSVVSTEVKFRKRNTPKEQTDESSSFQNVTPPGSVKSISNNVTGVVFRKNRSTPSAISTPSSMVVGDTPSSTRTGEPSTSTPTTPTPNRLTSATFRKQNLTEDTKKSKVSGVVENNPYALTKEQINQLSSVEAVVQVHKPNSIDDPDCKDYFDQIQHDIEKKTHYNTIVKELVQCIDEDIKNIPNFDFANWVSVSDIQCRTFDKCREFFEF